MRHCRMATMAISSCANVTNSNGEVGHSKSIPLIINDVPSFSVVPAPEWACDGACVCSVDTDHQREWV